MRLRFLAASGEATAAAACRLCQDELHENIRWGWLTNSKKRVQIPTAASCRSAGAIAADYPGRADEIDLRDIAFGTTKKSQLSYDATSGTLSVTDGIHTAVLRLGYAMAGGFAVSNDGYGGTLLTFEPSVTSITGGHGHDHGNSITSPVTS
jgi:hypothetical protein